MEIIVGESIVLPCQIACDPALDVSFSWAFNGQLINFQQDSDHFERVGGVSHLEASLRRDAFLAIPRLNGTYCVMWKGMLH